MGKYTKNYTLFGIAFGFAFPIMSLGLDMGVFHPLAFTLSNLVETHLNNPLHFIIDSAPIFLGIAFGFAGKFLDRAAKANEDLNEVNQDLVSKHHELISQTEEIQAQKEMMEEQTFELNKYHDRIKSSLNYARRIQRATLGIDASLYDRLMENMFILISPKDVVCGDFYWVHENEDYWFMAAVDCTGHGVPSAFMTIIGNNLLNQIVVNEKEHEPAQILSKLDDRLLKTLAKSTDDVNQVNDGMDVALCRISKSTQKLMFAGAKRPAVLVSPDKCEQVKGGRFPIGSFQYKNKEFKQEELTYTPGDRLFLFTDGPTDQFGGPKKTKFLAKKFREMLQENCTLPLNEQKEVTEKRLRDWQGSLPQTDDMLVMGIQL